MNSAGHKDKALWGKRAKWVDYWGKIDGHVVGVAIFDHPDNPASPTWWRPRDYGTSCGQPVWHSQLEGKKNKLGDMTIKKGESSPSGTHSSFATKGDAETAGIASFYDRWVQAMAASLKARAAGNN